MTNWLSFPDQVNLAPDTEGVYLLGNILKKVLYVGRADSLEQRLNQHPDPENPCLKEEEIRFFAYERTPNSEIREQQLINDFRPVCNNRV